uniref:Uncharacterized protein n=1 Tax=Oryza sativa subsp. japonica TaxID=39947 RepID=Q6Z4L9_ORYSJ|nr:hypothetical protein [Oryza sativa Japonica Group]
MTKVVLGKAPPWDLYGVREGGGLVTSFDKVSSGRDVVGSTLDCRYHFLGGNRGMVGPQLVW